MTLPHSHGYILAMLAIHSDDLGTLHECNRVTCKHATSFYTAWYNVMFIALCSGWNMIDLVLLSRQLLNVYILFTTIIIIMALGFMV